MTTRRTILLAIGAGSLAGTLGVRAQPSGKQWRVGLLLSSARPQNGLPPAPFRDAMAEMGYVQAVNVIYDGRWAEGKFDRLPAMAAELVQDRVDVMIVAGWQACNAAKMATQSIPIVALFVGDAVESGLVASLAHPGANLTGMSDMEAELSAKRLQLLKETVPKASRIAVLWNQDDLGMTLRYRQLVSAAKALGVTVQALGVREPDDFAGAFAAMERLYRER